MQTPVSVSREAASSEFAPADFPGLSISERHVGQMISAVEAGRADDALLNIRAETGGRARVIGVTGPPGSGKSTLVDVLAAHARERGMTVAILAIDPSSDRTGGAVLGDRVRMSRHSTDLGVYIRSMATRGSTRGLAAATRDAVRIVEAAGYDVVIVETVGIGQVELDIVRLADTVAVLTVPGLGDTMQMNKAGIMEVGDVFVVNMADRPETPTTVRELRQALAIGHRHDAMPAICTTVARTGEGVGALWEALEAHHGMLVKSGDLAARRLAHARAEFREIAEREWLTWLDRGLRRAPSYETVMADLDRGLVTPWTAAERLLAELEFDKER